MADPLPRYADLPVAAGAPAHSSWGLWGEGDRLGCLNLLDVGRGLAAARRGAVFALDLDLDLPDPPLFGRSAFRHTVRGSTNSNDDELDGWNTQASSQWDGFRHVRHPTHGHYDGVPDGEHGIHHWARRGVVGRAVLCDVGRWRASVGRPLDCGASDPIEAADLVSTLDAQGTTVDVGDVLLVRTGWLSWYRDLDGDRRRSVAADLRAPGLRPGFAMAEQLWDLHIAAVAADNPALEVWPPGALLSDDERDAVRADPERAPELFLHFSLLPLLGLPIGELWDLDSLAEDCAADGVYVALLTSAPLNLRAGVASPPNALAIK